MSTSEQKIGEDTIRDFGQQWLKFDNVDNGYYGSEILFADILFPLVRPEDVAGRYVAEVGSGTGRIVRMLLAAGASRVVAIEPSDAMVVLKRNVGELPGVDCMQISGAAIPSDLGLDWVFSIGVIHHIPDADTVVHACYRALKPGGRIAIWVYGLEGNRLYLLFALPFRWVAKRCPDKLLGWVSRCCVPPLRVYQLLCRLFPLPMFSYFRGHVSKLTNEQLVMTVFDQLNPAYAKYYTKREAEELLLRAGFSNVVLHHRHGYSWTVVGDKAASQSS